MLGALVLAGTLTSGKFGRTIRVLLPEIIASWQELCLEVCETML